MTFPRRRCLGAEYGRNTKSYRAVPLINTGYVIQTKHCVVGDAGPTPRSMRTKGVSSVLLRAAYSFMYSDGYSAQLRRCDAGKKKLELDGPEADINRSTSCSVLFHSPRALAGQSPHGKAFKDKSRPDLLISPIVTVVATK